MPRWFFIALVSVLVAIGYQYYQPMQTPSLTDKNTNLAPGAAFFNDPPVHHDVKPSAATSVINPSPVAEQTTEHIKTAPTPELTWQDLTLEQKVTILAQELKMTEDSLWSYQDVIASVERLRAIQTRHEDSQETYSMSTPVSASSLMVSSQALDPDGITGIEISNSLEGQISSVYLYFWLTNQDNNEQVLIRWVSLEDNFSHTQSYQLNADDPIHFAWLRKLSGWLPGRYRARLYSQDEGFPLLGTVDFSINAQPDIKLSAKLNDLSAP